MKSVELKMFMFIGHLQESLKEVILSFLYSETINEGGDTFIKWACPTTVSVRLNKIHLFIWKKIIWFKDVNGILHYMQNMKPFGIIVWRILTSSIKIDWAWGITNEEKCLQWKGRTTMDLQSWIDQKMKKLLQWKCRTTMDLPSWIDYVYLLTPYKWTPIKIRERMINITSCGKVKCCIWKLRCFFILFLRFPPPPLLLFFPCFIFLHIIVYIKTN